MRTKEDLDHIHDAVMDDGTGAEYYSAPESFKADTPGKVRWCMRTIKEAFYKRDGLVDAKDTAVVMYDRAIRNCDETELRMRALIEEGLNLQGLDGVADPVDGNTQFVAVPPKPIWPDEFTADGEHHTDDWMKLTDWAEKRGCIRVKRELDKKGIVSIIKKDGEVPDGVTMTEAGRTLKIEGVKP